MRNDKSVRSVCRSFGGRKKFPGAGGLPKVGETPVRYGSLIGGNAGIILSANVRCRIARRTGPLSFDCGSERRNVPLAVFRYRTRLPPRNCPAATSKKDGLSVPFFGPLRKFPFRIGRIICPGCRVRGKERHSRRHEIPSRRSVKPFRYAGRFVSGLPLFREVASVVGPLDENGTPRVASSECGENRVVAFFSPDSQARIQSGTVAAIVLPNGAMSIMYFSFGRPIRWAVASMIRKLA